MTLTIEQLRRETTNAPAFMLVPPSGDGAVKIVKVNYSGTVDPTVNDDSTQGYSVGSMWLNLTDTKTFFCHSSVVGVAVWDLVTTATGGSGGAERPITFFLGASLLHYPNQASLDPASTIQYTQKWLPAGTELVSMEFFLDDGGGGTEDVRLGLYSQTDVTDVSLEPSALVAQTGVKTLAGSDNGTYVQVPLLSNYTIPTSGYYWIAIVIDGTNAKLASTAEFREDFLPRREEELGSGTTLSDPAGDVDTLTNPLSACVHAAARRS